jgi:hypothetical protein
MFMMIAILFVCLVQQADEAESWRVGPDQALRKRGFCVASIAPGQNSSHATSRVSLDRLLQLVFQGC